MANYARIIDGIAIDVSTDPKNQFHPDIAAKFVEVPPGVSHGWRRDGSGNWAQPAAPEPEAEEPRNTRVSPVEFKLLFTAQERVAIKAARAADPVVDDFFDIVDDPRLTFVDLTLQSTKDALAYLEDHELIGRGRTAQIATGEFQ